MGGRQAPSPSRALPSGARTRPHPDPGRSERLLPAASSAGLAPAAAATLRVRERQGPSAPHRLPAAGGLPPSLGELGAGPRACASGAPRPTGRGAGKPSLFFGLQRRWPSFLSALLFRLRAFSHLRRDARGPPRWLPGRCIYDGRAWTAAPPARTTREPRAQNVPESFTCGAHWSSQPSVSTCFSSFLCSALGGSFPTNALEKPLFFFF